MISAAGGVGAAAGPLIGGLSRAVRDPVEPDPTSRFDIAGAVLSAVGLVLTVMGIMALDNSMRLAFLLVGAGGLVMVWFFVAIRAKERRGQEPLLSPGLFRIRTSNLGLVTQNTQWFILMGTSFVVSAYLQVVRGYNAIETGIIFTAATLGLLSTSLVAERLAQRRRQRTLVIGGFVVTVAGIALLLVLVTGTPSAWAFAPGLLLIGLGLGLMLTPSVNVVQSSFGEKSQGEISGLSRSVSNLGSSLGTAIAGTILVAGITATPERAYGLAMVAVSVAGLVGLVAAVLLPRSMAPGAMPGLASDTPLSEEA